MSDSNSVEKEGGRQIGYLPLAALYGKSSKSAEEAKARQIRHELSLTAEQRVELALNLGKREYSP